VFLEKGYQVELFSPRRRQVRGRRDERPARRERLLAGDLISMGFIHTPKLMALVEATRPVAGARRRRFDAIVVAGGQAPMFTSKRPPRCTRSSSSSTRPARSPRRCAMARRSSATPSSDGEYLVKGKTVTGFANVEEDFADNAVWSYGLLPRDKHVHALAHRGRA
jgi:putative intracellular protease/amidase